MSFFHVLFKNFLAKHQHRKWYFWQKISYSNYHITKCILLISPFWRVVTFSTYIVTIEIFM